MTAKLMHQTKITILLSLNAVVILIVGVMIFSAINLNGGIEFRVVSERSDIVPETLSSVSLLSPGLEELEAPVEEVPAGGNEDQSDVSNPSSDANSGSAGNGVSMGGTTVSTSSGRQDTSSAVPSGQLWAETAITIYQTADIDICVGGGLTGLGEMYWQTSDPSVIKAFASARTALGSNTETCRTPIIAGTGTVTITAGTYDGRRRDELTVTVIAPPVEQWKKDVLALVNQERAKVGVAPVSWGTTCASAANLRATEIMTLYDHTRPDGTKWSTACPVPSTGGKSGENLNAGGLAVSPETVVASWMNSALHRKNILDPDFKYLSVGFVFDPNSTYRTYWSQYFTTY